MVQKETAPVERVRLDKETVTKNERVSEDVRKEEIEYREELIASRHEGASGFGRVRPRLRSRPFRGRA